MSHSQRARLAHLNARLILTFMHTCMCAYECVYNRENVPNDAVNRGFLPGISLLERFRNKRTREKKREIVHGPK